MTTIGWHDEYAERDRQTGVTDEFGKMVGLVWERDGHFELYGHYERYG